MTTQPAILGLIPARGGSKGIPGKNIRALGGKPMIAWTIEAARHSRYPIRLVCSTDDPAIAEVAAAYGAEVPWLRPAELATDEATTLDVVRHALSAVDGVWTHLLLLQPTSPLREAEDIDGAIDLAFASGAHAVIGVTEAMDHPYLTFKMENDGAMAPYLRPDGISLRRQDLPAAYVINGALYVNRVESLLAHGTFLPPGLRAYPMPRERSVDIDDMEDWAQAEYRLRERHV